MIKRSAIVLVSAAASSLDLAVSANPAHAILLGFNNCTGALLCQVIDTPPNPIEPNPNNGILLGWDEVQNITLAEDLKVDRVFDEAASFVKEESGSYFLKAGTVVSSHYLQWDPANGNGTVEATIKLDSQAFAFITSDQNLFGSDALLGLPGLDYSDFTFRGLETGDVTNFNGQDVDINWYASNPGDWTRLITAFSPGGVVPDSESTPDEEVDSAPESIPEPASTLGLLAVGALAASNSLRKKVAF